MASDSYLRGGDADDYDDEEIVRNFLKRTQPPWKSKKQVMTDPRDHHHRKHHHTPHDPHSHRPHHSTQREEDVIYIPHNKEPPEASLWSRTKDALQGKHAKETPMFTIHTAETAGRVGIVMYAYHEMMSDSGPSGLMLLTLVELVFTFAFFLVTALTAMGSIVINGGAFWACMVGVVVIAFGVHISYMLEVWAKNTLFSHSYNNATNHPIAFSLVGYAIVLVVLGYFDATYPVGFFSTFDPDELDPLVYSLEISRYFDSYAFAALMLLWMIPQILSSFLRQRIPERKLYVHKGVDNGTMLYFKENDTEGQAVELTPGG